MYEHDNSPILGMIKEKKKTKYLVFNDRMKEVELPDNRFHIFHSAPVQLATNASDNYLKINRLLEEAKQRSQELVIADLWSFLQDDPREYNEQELAQLYFGEVTLATQISIRLSLLQDKTYFRRMKDVFQPRSTDIIEQLKLQQSVEENKRKVELELVQQFKDKQRDKSYHFTQEVQETLKLLEELAALGDKLDGPRHKEATKVLKLITDNFNLSDNLPAEDVAYNLLKLIHHFDDRTNLSLIRNDVPREFDPDLITAANSLNLSIAEDGHLPIVEVFTIDDESTQDMDDALSIGQLADGNIRLGIHITNVALYINEGTALNEEARCRASSIYLPDRIFNLFPEVIAENKCSILPQQSRSALSLFLTVNFSYDIITAEFTRTKIISKDRISYDEVDKKIDADEWAYKFLYNFTLKNEERRIAAGAMRIGKREALATPLSNGEYRLIQIDENSAARAMVAETMIIYNSYVAKYCAERNIAIPFRTQQKTEMNEQELEKIPQGPAADFYLRNQLKRSVTQATPSYHATLGLNFYTQATSPIRRYLDLVTQRQLLASLNNTQPHNAEYITSEVKATEEALAKANNLSKESKRFWLLKYLEKRAAKNNKIEGTVVRLDGRSPLVELDEIFIITTVRHMKKPVQLGEIRTFKIHKIIPHRDLLILEEG